MFADRTWKFLSLREVSLLFVTKDPIFTEHAARMVPGKRAGDAGSWQLSLVSPAGFRFPTESKYSDSCAGFRRWGGKDSYEQLPETQAAPLRCVVRTRRSILIDVPTTLVEETRYSFRLNVTAAERREDVALQEPWKLTVLESGQHLQRLGGLILGGL